MQSGMRDVASQANKQMPCRQLRQSTRTMQNVSRVLKGNGQVASHRPTLFCLASTRSSGGVVEKQAPGTHIKSVTRRPPIYKVLLHNDDHNKREYVVKVLIKVVQDMTVDDAVQVMQEAHETGVAMVQACPQDQAEQYCEALKLSGLSSTIEPGF